MSKWFMIIPAVFYILLSVFATYNFVFGYRVSFEWIYSIIVGALFCIQLKYDNVALGRIIGLFLFIAVIAIFFGSIHTVSCEESVSTWRLIVFFGFHIINFIMAVSFITYYGKRKSE